jgi:hypothetical protein
MQQGVKLSKRYLVLIVGVTLAILVVTTFVFTFLYQVRAHEMFRVTISCKGEYWAGHGGFIWDVCVEQLSHEELANVTVWVNMHGRSPFTGFFNDTTVYGAQKLFGSSPQPTNITVTWEGRSEVFLFNDLPIF